jgi:branched-chain amino acid transport system substrate-binding protein
MKKRYLIAGLLVLLLVVALTAVACGEPEVTNPTSGPENTVSTVAPSTETTAAPSTETTAAPSTETTAGPATGEPMKIGHIVDLTGAEAMVGDVMMKSLQFAVDSMGGQIAGRPVEVVIGDAQDQPAVAVDVARKMVEQDKVVAIFGPTQIGEKMAVANYLKSAGIPMLLYNPSPLVIFQDNPWVVGSGGSVPQCPTTMADYAYNTLKYSKIDTISQDNSAGRAFLDPFTEYFTKAGGTVVQQQWHPVPCPDFSPYLTTLKPADALVGWTAGADAITLFTQWHQLGIDKKYPMVGAFYGGFTESFIPMAMAPEDAAAMLGTLSTTFYSPEYAAQKFPDYWNGMTEALGFPPGDGAASGPYQAVLLFEAALKATSGDTTPDKLRDAIFSATIDGPEGPESFAPGEQAATKNISVVSIEAVPNAENTYHYVTVYTYGNVPAAGYAGQ